MSYDKKRGESTLLIQMNEKIQPLTSKPFLSRILKQHQNTQIEEISDNLQKIVKLLNDSLSNSEDIPKLKMVASDTTHQSRVSSKVGNALFDSISDAIFVISGRTGKIKNANIAAIELLEYEILELQKLKLTDIICPEDGASKWKEIKRDWMSSVNELMECEFRKKSGEFVQMEISLSYIESDFSSGEFIVVGRNITERKIK